MRPQLYQGDCLEFMAGLPAGSVDLTVTSPPYDNLRTYNGSLSDWNEAKWQAILTEMYRITKPGGVVVWVVGDATINGSETGTSFRQALYAMKCGFNLHDTMIWSKGSFSAIGALVTRYAPVFEYMFVLTKGPLRTFNPIKDRPNKYAGTSADHGTIRQPDGTTKPMTRKGKLIADFGQRFNVWDMPAQRQVGGHPAPFPVALAADHIASWSNPGDMVLDPFLGSGTTGVAAMQSGRRFIGIERDPEYFAICQKRIFGARRPAAVIDLEAVRREIAIAPAVAALQARLRA